MGWLGLLAVFAVMAPIGFHWAPRLFDSNRMSHPEGSTSALIPAGAGRIFATDEVDYWVSTDEPEGDVFVFHGIAISLPISHIEFWFRERALVAVTPEGERWEVGPRMRENFVSKIRACQGVQVIRTANQKSISGFWVPLVHGQRDPSIDDQIAGFRQRYVYMPEEHTFADCIAYGALSDPGRAYCDRVKAAAP